MKKIYKAVFPVAGLGTRFLPATKAIPKEMLPIVDKPLIQYAVEEAYAAGITEMIFITGRSKRSIEDYFDKTPELEAELLAKNKQKLLETVQSIAPVNVSFIYLRQSEPLGLGHAVLCAEPVVGSEPFAVILPDDLIASDEPAIGQLMSYREKIGGGSVLAVQTVPEDQTDKYGVVALQENSQSVIEKMVEKPKLGTAPSNLAVIGRYVFEPEIFSALKKVEKGIGGEIQLTDAISVGLSKGKTYAHCLNGVRYDCGSKQGFLQATVAFAKAQGYEIG